MRDNVWPGPVERLDRVLPALGLARSRTQAAALIAAGGVLVDGLPAMKAGQRIAAGSRVQAPAADPYVSRGAHKLIAALDAFGINVRDSVALDLGASTGGFTQVLLERGARVVQAIDVGHDQLAPELRRDPRVRLVEGCNARDLDAQALAEATGVVGAPRVVVADLSFISLTLILPAIVRCAAQDAQMVLLVKPQFEVGRVRDGIVTDPEQRAEALRTVLAAAAAQGLACTGIEASPITGGSGNVEYLAAFARAASPDPSEWEGRVAELSGAPQRNGAA